MRTRFFAAILLALPQLAGAQSMRGDGLYRFTLLRAAPGRLLELVGALKANGIAAPASKALRAAAKAAGFASDEHVGPYLRSLILDHHDSLLTPVR